MKRKAAKQSDKAQTSVRTRHGETMVKVTIETQSAVIQWDDILEATELRPDEISEAPWENDDGLKHEVVQDNTDGEAAGSFRDGRGRMMRVITSEFEAWGSASRGASKQVIFEAHAAEVKRTIEQLAKWHGNGWECYGAVCDFQGYHESCWGFYGEAGDEYLEEARAEIASAVAAQMEKDGFTIVGKPSPRRDKVKEFKNRIRLNMASQNFGRVS